MASEKAVQNYIQSFFAKLKQQGEPIRVERRQAGGYSYQMGVPDLYGTYAGIHFEIECKQVNGHARVMQEKFEERCKRQWLIEYIRPYTTEEFDEWWNDFYERAQNVLQYLVIKQK